MPDAAPAARGIYKPRRAQASLLFRLVSDHLHRLQVVLGGGVIAASRRVLPVRAA